MNKINVLIVDDSAIVRKVLKEELDRYPEISIVGTAPDPYIARNKIASLPIDVIVLDIEMPRMDGLTFLKHLMKHKPMPVIIVSSLTKERSDASVQAMKLGAVDIVPKPGGPYTVGEIIEELVQKIIGASKINLNKVTRKPKEPSKEQINNYRNILSRISTTKKLIAVGASTGGTSALETLFRNFDKNFPPTLAVIHMPEKFTYTFANRLNDICPLTIKEAVNGEIALNGHVYIAPGGLSHLMIKTSGADYIIKVVNAPKFNNHRPSVDVLFNSVAKHVGKNAYGILLTGMGRDGANGLLNIKQNGGYTICQDEQTSVVFGMPREAIEIGAADEVLPIDQIAFRVAEKLI